MYEEPQIEQGQKKTERDEWRDWAFKTKKKKRQKQKMNRERRGREQEVQRISGSDEEVQGCY